MAGQEICMREEKAVLARDRSQTTERADMYELRAVLTG